MWLEQKKNSKKKKKPIIYTQKRDVGYIRVSAAGGQLQVAFTGIKTTVLKANVL